MTVLFHEIIKEALKSAKTKIQKFTITLDVGFASYILCFPAIIYALTVEIPVVMCDQGFN